MKRKMKKTTKQYIIVAIMCIVIIGGAAAFTTYVMVDVAKDKYTAMLDDANNRLAQNERTVLLTVEDIGPGELITEDKVVRETILASYPQEDFMTMDEIGKTSLIAIRSGTGILSSMLSAQEIDKEIRELEYDVININSNINSEDTVDVRIMFPNGENYIILSKKIIRNYVPGQANCFLWLDEEELLRMSAAIVDASLYNGTKLYITKYVEPAIQEASKITYTPSLSILSLLETNPNILEISSKELSKDVRKALENRLARSMELNVAETDWNVPDNTFSGEPESVQKDENGNEIPIENIPDEFDNESAIDILPPMIETGQIDDEQISDDYLYYADEVSLLEEVPELGE